jgi:hypothetical protein
MITQSPLSTARRTRPGEKLPTPTHMCAVTRSGRPACPEFRSVSPEIRRAPLHRSSAVRLAPRFEATEGRHRLRSHTRASLCFSSKTVARQRHLLPVLRNEGRSLTRATVSQITHRDSRATDFLIANLELEFRPTHRKISLLKIPNRKFFAILHLVSQQRPRVALATSYSSLATALLIVTPRLKNRVSRGKQRSKPKFQSLQNVGFASRILPLEIAKECWALRWQDRAWGDWG